MSRTKYFTGNCQHCAGHIEFPVESIGLTADCPHCGQPTELMLPPPPMESSVPRRWLVLTVVAIAILVGGLITCLVLLKHFENRLARHKADAAAAAAAVTAGRSNSSAAPIGAPKPPAGQNGFRVSPVTLEKTPGSSLVYVVGTLTNTTGRQRFGVRILFDLLDANGQPVGTAKDYQAVLEPGGQWRFKALMVEEKAVAARVASIQEEQ